jgi:hypothetical protein
MMRVVTSAENDEYNDEPEPAAVSSRASGRPPEEESSDDPERQAEVILEESEDRTIEGAEKSK